MVLFENVLILSGGDMVRVCPGYYLKASVALIAVIGGLIALEEGAWPSVRAFIWDDIVLMWHWRLVQLEFIILMLFMVSLAALMGWLCGLLKRIGDRQEAAARSPGGGPDILNRISQIDS